jgi:tRNA A-37 threonylcarbamoyl transferase component Bud32
MTSGRCPTCGAELPENAPQGLCPKCLLVGVAAPTEAGSTPEQHPAPPAVEAVRAAFPQLEILELIGQGGMGAVFKARQPKLNRFVALKILPESMARDPTFAERLAREGQLLARLTHPNVVTVHDFGSANGFFYLLMEYVDGVNLRQAMQAGRFTAEQALAIVPMICEALQYAHDEGVLHRDIKPENILLDTKGRVKLADFGIAKLAGRDEAPAAGSNPGAPADIALTQTGSALGTPSYMAPEQRSSPSTVDQRADIYSLGVVFYEMLTGELPTGNFPRPSSKTPMDPRVDDVVMRAMARQKEQRFRTAAEVRTSVEGITASLESTFKSRPDIPAAARAYPVPINRTLEHALTFGLVLLLILEVVGLRFLPWFIYGQVYGVLRDDWLQRFVALVGFTFIGWLTFQVWRRHIWFTEPLRLLPDPTTATGSLSGGAIGRAWGPWLTLAWMGALGVLGIQVLWMLLGQVVLVAQMVRTLPQLPHPTGMKLMFLIDVVLYGSGGLLLGLLAFVLVRRELRRSDVSLPASAPAWMPRAALLTLIFAIVTSLPMGMVYSLTGAFAFAAVSNGGLLISFALALLTRSRIWRSIALALLMSVLITGLSSSTFLLVLAPWHQWPSGWSHPMSEASAVVIMIGTQLLGVFCCALGLIALLLPSARAAFGLPPRKGRGTEPAVAPVHA